MKTEQYMNTIYYHHHVGVLVDDDVDDDDIDDIDVDAVEVVDDDDIDVDADEVVDDDDEFVRKRFVSLVWKDCRVVEKACRCDAF